MVKGSPLQLLPPAVVAPLGARGSGPGTPLLPVALTQVSSLAHLAVQTCSSWGPLVALWGGRQEPLRRWWWRQVGAGG